MDSHTQNRSRGPNRRPGASVRAVIGAVSLGLALAACESSEEISKAHYVPDLTRLNADGGVYKGSGDFSTQPWACVRDNKSALVWEVKSVAAGLHHQDNTYTWHDPDADTNGGDAGKPDGGACSGSRCDTVSYQKAVNAERLCGFDDWRLPSRMEMSSLILPTVPYPGPTIAADRFPNTPNGSYWTATTFATHGGGAWAWRFDHGYDYVALKTEPLRVRLVRGTLDVSRLK